MDKVVGVSEVPLPQYPGQCLNHRVCIEELVKCGNPSRQVVRQGVEGESTALHLIPRRPSVGGLFEQLAG